MEKSLIIFDLDGTLLDTIVDITESLNYALKSNGYNTITRADALRFIGSGMKILIKRCLDYVSESYSNEDYDKVLESYSQYYASHNTCLTKPFEGIYEVLSCLKKKYKLAVCSNKPYQDTLNVVNTYFKDTFDFVYGHMAPFNIKPDPNIIYYICEKMNVKKEKAILIGDSEVDVKCGQNAGIDTALCMWGYLHLEELDKISPTYVVNNPLELLEIK